MAFIGDINISIKFLKITRSLLLKFTLLVKYYFITARLILDYLVLSSAIL